MNNDGNPRVRIFRTHRIWTAIAALLLITSCGGGGGAEGTAPSSTTQPADLTGFPTAADAYEGTAGDDSTASAGQLPIGSRQSRTLFPAGDKDYVKVALVAGTAYEFSASRLNYNGDTELLLYGPDGSSLVASDDDYIGLDSRILFTPAASGSYYLKVEAVDIPTVKDDQRDVASYLLGAREFSDHDGDTFSPYYDCDDARGDVFPLAMETAGDGVDQDCSGADVPAGSTADIAEVDDTVQAARVMAPVVTSPFEPLFERAMYVANTRSLSAGDVDYFSVEIPAHGAVEIDLADYDLTVLGTLYGSDGMTPVEGPEQLPYFYVVNTQSGPRTVYVKYQAYVAGETGYYVPFYAGLGVDLDGDTYFTEDWISVRDCNDTDPTIHPRAADGIDGVDQNCDGQDGVVP